NGLTEVKVDSISILKNSSPVLNPKIISVPDETTEANLVKFNNAWLVDPSQWTISKTSFNTLVTNGKDTITLYISNATNLFHSPTPQGKFNITGIGSQSTTSLPAFGGYFIMPRSIADVNNIPPKFYTIGSVKPYDAATGIADSINTYCMLRGIVISKNISGNSSTSFSIEDSTGAIMINEAFALGGYAPSEGDSVKIRGTVRQTNGLTYFDADSLSKNSILAFKWQKINADTLNESYESHYIKYNTLLFTGQVSWDTASPSGHVFITVNSNNGPVLLEFVKGTYCYKLGKIPAGTLEASGICSQADSSSPYFSNYFIIPIDSEDLRINSGIEPGSATDHKVNMYPNPVRDNLMINASFNMEKIEIMDMTGRTVEIQKPGSDNYKLSLRQLRPGVYISRIDSGENSIYRKIVRN